MPAIFGGQLLPGCALAAVVLSCQIRFLVFLSLLKLAHNFVVDSHDWAMHDRMAAEDMILKGVSWKDHEKHYCIHHTHHNMYDCQTHRSSFEGAELRPIRKDARCMFDHLYKNYKVKMSFPEYCYSSNESFPRIPTNS
jgi:hypothetical protein